MGGIGNPITSSLVQAAQAQQVAAKARDRSRATETERKDERGDRLDIRRVDETEEVDAVRAAAGEDEPANDGGGTGGQPAPNARPEADSEASADGETQDPPPPRLDLQA